MLLHEKLKGCRLILASASPRRHQLLSECGLEFSLADKYEVDESYPESMVAEQVPLYLSQVKSDAYSQPLKGHEILLTADTVVILDDKVLGKPKDEQDAKQMLASLSGRQHTVVTGVTIRTAGQQQTFAARSDVWFRELSTEEIDFYVESFKPMDKAGSYGIQEWIGYAAIERIDGSFYNVMGLPIQKVYVELDKFFKQL